MCVESGRVVSNQMRRIGPSRVELSRVEASWVEPGRAGGTECKAEDERQPRAMRQSTDRTRVPRPPKKGAGTVLDASDTTVGEWDAGRGYVTDEHGSVLAELRKEGTVVGNGGFTAGYIDGFTFASTRTLAAYVLLVDPAFVAGY